MIQDDTILQEETTRKSATGFNRGFEPLHLPPEQEQINRNKNIERNF